MAGIATAVVGVLIGLPTLRLRGDYLAIVTLGFGEILPQIARNGDNLFGTGFNLTNGTGGITPIDGPGFGNWLDKHLHLPANFLTAANLDSVFFWTALVLVLITVFCSARLRDSRLGRAWIAIREDEIGRGGDGRAADAHEDVGVRDRRVLRRRRRRVLRVVQERRVPRRLLLPDLGLHPLHGDPRRHGEHLGRHLRRVLPHVPRPRRALEHRHADQQPASARTIDVPKYEFGIFGDHHRRHDALPARGADPELAPRRRAARRRARRAALRRTRSPVPDELLQTRAAPQGVRRPRRGRRRRLHRAARARSSA